MIKPTHTVTFAEITRHEVELEALSDAEAITIAKRYTETLSPTAKARTFVSGDTSYEQFEVTPILKVFDVKVDARVIYEIAVRARDAEDAKVKAEELWNRKGTSSFDFLDHLDLHFEAEEALS